MGLPPPSLVGGDHADHAVQAYADMRADLRDWASMWFDDHSCLARNSAPLQEWRVAFVIEMFNQGGNNQLRQLPFRLLPGRTLQE
eukprot:2159186-Pyramimonas_sp.AAC.1